MDEACGRLAPEFLTFKRFEMASPDGGPPRSGACLARNQRLRFYFILISDGKSEVKSEVKSVGELKMGFLKMEN